MITDPEYMNESIGPIHDEIIAFWQPRFQRKLSAEDAREIIYNTQSYFRTLAEWDLAEHRQDASDVHSQNDPERAHTTEIDRSPGKRRCTGEYGPRHPAVQEEVA